MPFVLPSSAAGVPVGPAKRKRFGCIAARIGSQQAHRLGVTAEGARAGSIVHAIVKDVTRHPEEAEQAKWVCRHAACASKSWQSKAALLKDHPENRILDKQEETHLYLAVFEAEATPAVAEKRDEKSGKVTQAAVDAKPARLLLLSDEE